MQSWNQRKRWAQGHFDVANRYIGKLFVKGFKERNIVVLDGIINLFQPYFLLISTFFVICSYIYQFYPFYTNVLYAILPLEVWTLIGIGQYIFPMIVLFKIHASFKSWMYLLFTSESVSEGHPDKVADQISDALLDEFLAYDKNSKVACETLVTTGQVVLAGEVKSSAYVDVQEVARGVIEKIGYTKSEYQFEAKS